MTTVMTRWLSIAAINAALITPALAIDEGFGDEKAASPQPQPAPALAEQSTPSDPASAPATDAASSSNSYANNDDPLTFNTLRRITLKQLSVDANASQPESVKDPLQPINRKIFKFNNTLDQYVLLPVAKTYKNRVPALVRGTVGNFFSNLREPWNAVNHLLQGNPTLTYKSLGRFTVNTITSLGLADPATQLGINSRDEDFGQTLGKWGVKSGPFLMLPVLGPSTLRDTTGRFADVYGRPLYYAGQDSTYWGLNLLQGVDARSRFIGVEDLVQGDQYALLRDLYLQRRQYLISGTEQANNGIDNSFGDEGASFGDGSDANPDANNENSGSDSSGFGDENSGAPSNSNSTEQTPVANSPASQDTVPSAAPAGSNVPASSNPPANSNSQPDASAPYSDDSTQIVYDTEQPSTVEMALTTAIDSLAIEASLS
ncbi:MAG: hypothetical protein EOP49_14605 [Sphingobacteriales bacterium]|nr:MAG: hypothetical protein EOP49_14605 [Sphingobacteriales bacterium]